METIDYEYKASIIFSAQPSHNKPEGDELLRVY